jgi:hypothetical protein
MFYFSSDSFRYLSPDFTPCPPLSSHSSPSPSFDPQCRKSYKKKEEKKKMIMKEVREEELEEEEEDEGNNKKRLDFQLWGGS